MLFDPSRQSDRDRAISDFIDPNSGGGNAQNKWQLLQLFQGDALRVYEISLWCETKKKLEVSLVIMRTVHDPAVENRRIRDANMIVIKTEQDRCTGRQADHFASVAPNLDRVIGPRWLADRDHERRNKGLNRVLHCETNRETDDTSSIQDCRQKRRRPHDIKRYNQATDHEAKSQDLAINVSNKSVRCEPVTRLTHLDDEKPDKPTDDRRQKRNRS